MIGILELACALMLSGAGGDFPPGFRLEDSPESDLHRRLAGAGIEDQDEEKPKQEESKPSASPDRPPSQELPSQSVVDFGWLELYPRAGLAVFSSKYHIHASPVLEIEGHAPIPWFSPDSNPNGDYFGAFAHLNFAVIKRTIEPKLAKASGMMVSLAFGLDYTFYRDDTWLLLARAGIQYTTYGGVTDLEDGGQVVAGITAGMSLSRSFMITLTPEIVYAKTGDHIMMGLIGVAVEF